MNNYVTDTMAFILALENRKMPKKVKLIYEDAINNNVKIFVPSIVFAELAYLSEKLRIDTSLNEARKYLIQHPFIVEFPMT